MKVKLGNAIFDSELEPIMLILSEEDKYNISHMAPEATKYCSYPDKEDLTPETIEAWMEEEVPTVISMMEYWMSNLNKEKP